MDALINDIVLMVHELEIELLRDNWSSDFGEKVGKLKAMREITEAIERWSECDATRSNRNGLLNFEKARSEIMEKLSRDFSSR